MRRLLRYIKQLLSFLLFWPTSVESPALSGRVMGALIMASDRLGEKTRCLLIGARGFLGRRIAQELDRRGIDVVGTTRSRLDSDPSNWVSFEFPRDDIAAQLPDDRFHIVIVGGRLFEQPVASGASKDDGHHNADRYDRLFAQLNVMGCPGAPPRIVYVSSDAVFSGSKGGYVETDKPDSLEAYGAMHIAAERSLQAMASNHAVVRASFLYDVAEFRDDKRLCRLHSTLTSNAPFAADTDVFKSPVPVERVAAAIVRRAVAGPGGIVHVPGERKSIYRFFADCLEPLGLQGFREKLVPRQSGRVTDTSLQTACRMGAA
jgi:dTDP-4-dehydrorhamnose reductase